MERDFGAEEIPRTLEMMPHRHQLLFAATRLTEQLLFLLGSQSLVLAALDDQASMPAVVFFLFQKFIVCMCL